MSRIINALVRLFTGNCVARHPVKVYRGQRCISSACHESHYLPTSVVSLDCCPICLDEGNVWKIVMVDGCDHVMCRRCARKWFREHSTCPQCRRKCRQAITAHWVFTGEEKEMLFRHHARCLKRETIKAYRSGKGRLVVFSSSCRSLREAANSFY